MANVPPKRPKRRNHGGIHRAIEAAEDTADAVRIVVSDLRKLLDPLGSRPLARAFGQLEQHASDLDKLAEALSTFAEEGKENVRP